ncbi:Syntaxin-22 [Smittium mucronatum]|uniref:Syntaxin-22 n=1 Tax=Smittium mucronatum TaxID=133383 RepID=A0A1R0GYH0_9FUNG|nr:Syntaxin-22 [Smittium mucronatum]
MSFNDLDNNSVPALYLQSSDNNGQYESMIKKISLLIFDLNSRVSKVMQYVDWMGSNRDSSALRAKLHSETNTIKDLFKQVSENVRDLNSYKQNDIFQNVQNLEAVKSRQLVEAAKQTVSINVADSDSDENESRGLLSAQTYANNTQKQQVQSSIDNEIYHNSAMIAERESEIQDIEQGILELNEIFKDLGTIVSDQQSLLDNIETNVNNVAVYTSSASNELTIANETHRRNQKTKNLILLFVVIVFIVLFTMLIS